MHCHLRMELFCTYLTRFVSFHSSKDYPKSEEICLFVQVLLISIVVSPLDVVYSSIDQMFESVNTRLQDWSTNLFDSIFLDNNYN